jgi:hypothetical protein
MKHGDKAKAKSAKTKASGKEAGSKKVAAKSSKGAEKTGGKAVKAGGSKVVPKAAAKAGPSGKADNGKGKGVVAPGGINFSNPVIAEAFRRAIKKYPSAFRRLTD